MDETTKKEKRILLVEDDLYIRELYAKTLKREGYNIIELEDGEKAFAAMSEGGFDLVLLDIMMPQIDGLTVLKKLAETPPKTFNRKIIMLTNLNQDSLIFECLSLGAAGYLIKDQVTPAELTKIIEGHLLS